MKKIIEILFIATLVLTLSSCDSGIDRIEDLDFEILDVETNGFTAAYDLGDNEYNDVILLSGVFKEEGLMKILTYSYDLEDGFYSRLGEFTCTETCEVIGYYGLDTIDSFIVFKSDGEYYIDHIYTQGGLGRLNLHNYSLSRDVTSFLNETEFDTLDSFITEVKDNSMDTWYDNSINVDGNYYFIAIDDNNRLDIYKVKSE